MLVESIEIAKNKKSVSIKFMNNDNSTITERNYEDYRCGLTYNFTKTETKTEKNDGLFSTYEKDIQDTNYKLYIRFHKKKNEAMFASAYTYQNVNDSENMKKIVYHLDVACSPSAFNKARVNDEPNVGHQIVELISICDGMIAGQLPMHRLENIFKNKQAIVDELNQLLNDTNIKRKFEAFEYEMRSLATEDDPIKFTDKGEPISNPKVEAIIGRLKEAYQKALCIDKKRSIEKNDVVITMKKIIEKPIDEQNPKKITKFLLDLPDVEGKEKVILLEATPYALMTWIRKGFEVVCLPQGDTDEDNEYYKQSNKESNVGMIQQILGFKTKNIDAVYATIQSIMSNAAQPARSIAAAQPAAQSAAQSTPAIAAVEEEAVAGLRRSQRKRNRRAEEEISDVWRYI